MRKAHRLTAGALAVALGASLMAVPVAARASEEGRRNTALALGAAAAALLLTQRDKTAGVIAAAGAAFAYKRYNDSVNDRRNRERYGYYDYRYDRYGDRYNDRYDRNRNDDRYYSDRYNRDGYNRDSYNRDSYGRNDRDDRWDGGYDNGRNYVRSRRR